MKKLLGVVLVLLVGVLIFLQFFLGKTIKSVVEKNAKNFLTAKVEMQELNFNILGGSVELKGLKVHNPVGFAGDFLYSLERSFEDLGLLSLLSGKIVIEDIAIKNSDLLVVRNKEGKFNFMELLKKAEETKEKAEVKKEEKAQVEEADKDMEEAPMSLPNVLLSKMDITAALNYVDYKISSKPFEIGFETVVTAKDLATYGPADQEGVLTIMGSLKGNKAEFITDIKLVAPPLVDLANPTFTLTGSIKSVDMKKLEAYKGDTGISEGKLDITFNIVCVDGQIQKEQSLQAITIKDLKTTEELKQEKLKGMEPPQDIQFSFHLFGDLKAPQNDFLESFIKAIFNPASLLKAQGVEALKSKLNLGGDKKMDKNVLGGLLGGGALGVAGDKKQETKAQEPVKEEKAASLGGILGTLGGEKSEKTEEKTEENKKVSLPFGGAKNLF